MPTEVSLIIATIVPIFDVARRVDAGGGVSMDRDD
jgi:hypothetical protein